MEITQFILNVYFKHVCIFCDILVNLGYLNRLCGTGNLKTTESRFSQLSWGSDEGSGSKSTEFSLCFTSWKVFPRTLGQTLQGPTSEKKEKFQYEL